MWFGDFPHGGLDRESAGTVIVPVPFDGTSTWLKGADQGPAAMLDAADQLECYDLVTGTEPCLNGIWIDAPVVSERVEDMVLGTAATVGKWLDAGRRVVTLGGEHSVSIGAVQAHAARNEGLSVLHLDAHGDNRDRYEESRLNHACTMARIREMCDPCVSVGLRSVDASEMAVLVPERTFFAHDIAAAGDDAWMDRVAAALGDTVYITIDLDVFDPSVIAATGTPVPGGLSWYQVTALLAKVIQRRRVVGFDIVELCPTIPHPPSVMAAVTLLYHVLALMDRQKAGS